MIGNVKKTFFTLCVTGKKGSKIRELQDATGTTIKVMLYMY